MRLTVRALDEMLGEPLYAFRLDTSGGPTVEPAGFEEVSDDDPARRLPAQYRSGGEHEARIARTHVLARRCRSPPVALPQADVAQQPGDQRSMHPVDRRRRVLLAGAEGGGDAPQPADQGPPPPPPPGVGGLPPAHP